MKSVAKDASPLAGLSLDATRVATGAVEALRRGEPDRAAKLFAPLLAQQPRHAGLLRLAGMAERLCGRTDRARQLLARAVRADPQDALAATSHGLALMQSAAMDAGLAELRRACALGPGVAMLWNNLGKALLDANRLEQAIEPLSKAVSIDPGFHPARFSLAYALGVCGDVASAAGHYRTLLAQREDDGEAWIGLAQLKRGLLDDSDLARMRELLQRPGLDQADRIALEFASADVLHQHGDVDGAFAAWQRANAGVRARHPWDAAAHASLVDAVLATRWPQAVAPNASRRVIFVVGLPRSSTSIVEQILDCHPDVAAAGETDALGRVLHAAAAHQGGEYPAALAAQDDAAWRRLGADYLQAVGDGLPASPCLTDKLPGNWLYVGAALAMLPGARVVVCRRDPMEAGFSCFRQRFAGTSQGFSYALEDIGRYWFHFDRACRDWRKRYPGHLMDLDVEALAATPEKVIRELLAFCGLAFVPECLHPERNARGVRTMSATQVRNPLQPVPKLAPAYASLLEPMRLTMASGNGTPAGGA